jgi:monofunctional glycosyltransferase
MKKIKFILLVVIAVFAVDIGRYFVYPNVSELKKTNPIPSAFMERKMKQWEEEGKKKTIVQQWVQIKQISPYLIKAVLISEDDKFYTHDGFDIEAIEGAIERNIKSGQFSFGGSTISQQLSKNLYLSPSKNPIRKVKEAIITWRIERELSKSRILEIYLNIAQWGDNIFGIEAASKHYFGKSAKNLTAMEASRLASVLPNPVLYNPTSDRKFVVNKSNRIYKIMQRRGIVEPEFKEVVTDINQDEVQIGNIEEIENRENNTQEIEEIEKPENIENQTVDNIEDIATQYDSIDSESSSE